MSDAVFYRIFQGFILCSAVIQRISRPRYIPKERCAQTESEAELRLRSLGILTQVCHGSPGRVLSLLGLHANHLELRVKGVGLRAWSCTCCSLAGHDEVRKGSGFSVITCLRKPKTSNSKAIYQKPTVQLQAHVRPKICLKDHGT